MSRHPSAPAPRTVLDDLPFCLARAALNFRRLNDQTLRASGLKSLAPGAASVLHALAELDGGTVSRLVERTHLPNGTLTGLLDVLERDGQIERRANPEDGRSWKLGLTKQGRRLAGELEKRHRRVMELFGEVLTADEQDELARLLEKLGTRIRTYTAGDGALRKKGQTPKAPRRRQ